jgi:ribonuclease HI
MTLDELADAMTSGLQEQGIMATPGPSMNNQYAAKLLVQMQNGPSLGAIKLYVGKRGPTLVPDELHSCPPAIRSTITEVWQRISRGNSATPRGRDTLSIDPSVIQVWVDGACLQAPLGYRFGWAFVIQQSDRELHRDSGSLLQSGAFEHRNVGAELEAATRALTWCVLNGYKQVTVYHDYKGIAAWPTGAWRANTSSTREYARFIKALPLAITWQKVPAHQGIAMNELVDQLANRAAADSPALPVPASRTPEPEM